MCVVDDELSAAVGVCDDVAVVVDDLDFSFDDAGGWFVAGWGGVDGDVFDLCVYVYGADS